MNGGTGSTPPVRQPIARPVSFHSLSEHNSRNNPAYLSPYSHRRPRTPRSSPLAGPSLSSEQLNGDSKDDEGSQKPRYRPNRISSTPDMAGRTQSLYNPDTSSSATTVVPQPPNSNSSASSSSDEDDKEKEPGKGKEEDGSRLRNFAKRLSIVSTSSLATTEADKDSQKAKKRRSSFLLHSTSTTSLASTSSSRTARTDKTSETAPPIPTIPRWALNAMREEAGAANRNMKYGHRRGTSHDQSSSSSPLSNQPIPRGVPLSSSGLTNQPRTPSVSRDPSENWMSVTDPIPKFSRLGLGGDAVVLPVKKKESLGKMKSSTSINSSRSSVTISQSAATRRDSGNMTRTEPSPGADSPNVTIADAKLKEESLRKRSSSLSSLKAKIPRISVSSSTSTESENVPPLPPSINQLGSGPASVSNSHTASKDPTQKTPKMTAFPLIVDTPSTRGSVTLRRDSGLAAIDENLPPPSDNTEAGTKAGDVKPQDAQKARARRKSIKQIVMRITTAPLAAGEKLKFGGFHTTPSTPVVVLPPDTLVPLDPPPTAWFRKPASSSVPSLACTKETSEFTHSGKKFKGIRKKWNAVLETIRR